MIHHISANNTPSNPSHCCIGLDQPYEAVCFWIQHVLMLFTALFLLVRNNYVSYRLMTLRTLALGNWLIFVFHIVVFAPMDRYFLVNVQFFLCPSEGNEPTLPH